MKNILLFLIVLSCAQPYDPGADPRVNNIDEFLAHKLSSGFRVISRTSDSITFADDISTTFIIITGLSNKFDEFTYQRSGGKIKQNEFQRLSDFFFELFKFHMVSIETLFIETNTKKYAKSPQHDFGGNFRIYAGSFQAGITFGIIQE